MALQRGEDSAWMHRESLAAALLQPRIHAQREQAVRGLGLAIGLPLVIAAIGPVGIVPADIRKLVPGGRQRHHPRILRSLDQRQQGRRQRKMAHMVGAELQLPARPHPHFRTGHDASIIDQQIERRVVGGKAECEPLDRCDIGQIHQRDADIAGHACQRRIGLFGIARRHGDRCARCRQRAHRFQPDPRIAAGDDHHLALEVDAFEHLMRFAMAAERGIDRLLVVGDHRRLSLRVRRFRRAPLRADNRHNPGHPPLPCRSPARSRR